MRMKKFALAALACIFAASAAVAAPLDVFKGQKGEVDIAGGTAHIPVMQEAAKRIMTLNPDIRITVAGGGSGVGVKQVGEGLVEIGNTGRPLKAEEVEKYGLKSFPFAIDGVAVVVHPSNAVAELTFAQVADIYAGKITNWKEVGGADAKINLYVREDGSGTREVFTDKAIKGGEVAASANVVNSNGAMKTAVAKDTNAIGYVGIGHIDAAYGGKDGTAFTALAKTPDGWRAYIRLWPERHVDDCLPEILRLCKELRIGTIFCEKNADKGYLRKRIIRMGHPCRGYTENQNKFIKVSTYLRAEWAGLRLLDCDAYPLDAEAVNQVLDYNENAEHDDMPDSLASAIRAYGQRPQIRGFKEGV